MGRISGNVLTSLSSWEIGEINNIEISIDEKIEIAVNKLNDYKDIFGIKVDATYEKDIWTFRDTLKNKNIVFDFNIFIKEIRYKNCEEKVEVINNLKLWTVDILSENALPTAYCYYLDVKSGILSTSFYSKNLVKKWVDKISQRRIYRDNGSGEFKIKDVKETVITQYIAHNLSLMRFLKIDNSINELIDIYNKCDKRNRNRKLPNFRIFTEFEILINQWYDQVKSSSDKNLKLEYFPLLIWFNIASIIPMRPSEFCLIKKDNFEFKDKNWYISFPRLKKKRKNKYKTEMKMESLPISDNVYNLICEYKQLVEGENDTEYLIGYNTYIKYSLKSNKYKDNMIFSSIELNKLIKQFYSNYISKYCNKVINTLYESDDELYIETSINDLEDDTIYEMTDREYILGGDLRHIAIINMMMQGYSEIEIERIAGHTTKDTQMNYAAHAENWMNVEVLKLQKEIRFYDYGSEHRIYPQSIDNINNMIEKNYLEDELIEKDLQKFIKLKIGYCTDSDMGCTTFNWKHSGCYFCSNWIITNEELEEKREIIERDLNLIYDETIDKIYFLNSLFNKSIKKQLQNHKEKIKSISEEVKDNIYNIARLKEMLGE